MEDQGNSWMVESMIDKEKLGERPKMEIPQAQLDYVDLMKLRTRQGMPGEDILKADVEQAGATTRGAFANLSGADAAAGMLGESAQRMRGLRAIGLEAARYGERQETAYAGAVQSNAPWQQEMWLENQRYPWEIGKNEQQAKWNMGAQFKYGAQDQSAAANIMGANMMSQQAFGMGQNPNNQWGQWGGGGGGASMGGAPMAVPQGYQQGAQLQSQTGQSTFLPGVNQWGF